MPFAVWSTNMFVWCVMQPKDLHGRVRHERTRRAASTRRPSSRRRRRCRRRRRLRRRARAARATRAFGIGRRHRARCRLRTSPITGVEGRALVGAAGRPRRRRPSSTSPCPQLQTSFAAACRRRGGRRRPEALVQLAPAAAAPAVARRRRPPRGSWGWSRSLTTWACVVASHATRGPALMVRACPAASSGQATSLAPRAGGICWCLITPLVEKNDIPSTA